MHVGLWLVFSIAFAGAGCTRGTRGAHGTTPTPTPTTIAPQSPEPPATRREPVVEEHFGTRVVDPYRWMEARTDPRVVAWMRAQDGHARAALERIPGRDALLARVAARSGGGEVARDVRLAGGKRFYLKRRPEDQAFKLYVQRPGEAARVIVDPSALAGGPHAIDFYEPSLDGARVAFAVSAGGSEASVLRVIDLATGALAPEAIDRTNDARPAWRADGRSFFYNRLAEPAPGAAAADTYLNSRVYLHAVGTDPAQDRAILGAGVPGSPPLAPSDSAWIETFPGSPYALAMISHGTDPALTIYIASLDAIARPAAPGTWRRVAAVEHGVADAVLHGSDLYLMSRAGAPRYQVLRTSAAAPDAAHAEVIVPASQRVIRAIGATRDALYVVELDGGAGAIRRFDFVARRLEEVALPVAGTVRGPVVDPTGSTVLVGIGSWLAPETWYERASSRLEPVELVARWPMDVSRFLVEEVKVPSWDGTEIPLSIVRRRDLPLDGRNPVWLTAYGSYGIPLTPRFIPRLLPLLEDGGVYAVAHVRGGGEYGEPWHRAGRLANKPNTHKDVIACAEHLIARGYGSTSTLALDGASAGGIGVGMAMIARPDLFRVVFSQVGDHNPLRIEVGADGPALAQEFGTTKTEAGFRALLAIDATQAVRPGTPYPAVLLGAGFNDPRVPPWHPGKLAAHLQAATTSRRPVLLRVDFDAGHGMASSKALLDGWVADQLAFLYWQLGRPAYQPRP